MGVFRTLGLRLLSVTTGYRHLKNVDFFDKTGTAIHGLGEGVIGREPDLALVLTK